MVVSNVIEALRKHAYNPDTSSPLLVDFYVGPSNIKTTYHSDVLELLDVLDREGRIRLLMIKTGVGDEIVLHRKGHRENGYWEPIYYFVGGRRGETPEQIENQKSLFNELYEKVGKIEVKPRPKIAKINEAGIKADGFS